MEGDHYSSVVQAYPSYRGAIGAWVPCSTAGSGKAATGWLTQGTQGTQGTAWQTVPAMETRTSRSVLSTIL